MNTIFKNIKELVQVRPESISFVAGKQMKELPTIKNAYLIVKNGLISDFGTNLIEKVYLKGKEL